jgi:cytoskeletal protein CcmA (bactofilin family)
MFQKDKNNTAPDKISNSATLISAGTELTGDVKSDSDIRIDGTIFGNVISSARIVVGPSGYIEGNVQGKQADITGKVSGNIVVQDTLQLRSQSNVQGNITAATLQIDPAATFNGKCQMGAQASVVMMSREEEAAAVEAN